MLSSIWILNNFIQHKNMILFPSKRIIHILSTSFLKNKWLNSCNFSSVSSLQFPSVQISNSHLVPRIWFTCQSSFMRCFRLTLILDNTLMGWADGVLHLLLQGMRKSERSQGRDGTIATFFSFVKGPVFLVNLVGNIGYRLLGELADYFKWIKLKSLIISSGLGWRVSGSPNISMS